MGMGGAADEGTELRRGKGDAKGMQQQLHSKSTNSPGCPVTAWPRLLRIWTLPEKGADVRNDLSVGRNGFQLYKFRLPCLEGSKGFP